jgi:hypothetical protein
MACPIAVLALPAAALLAGLTPAPALADHDRPAIVAFSARDEGSLIQLEARYCDYAGPGAAKHRSTFWLLDASQRVVARRSLTRLSVRRCATARAWWPDLFSSGVYYARIEISNLGTGGFVRSPARSFVVL